MTVGVRCRGVKGEQGGKGEGGGDSWREGYWSNKRRRSATCSQINSSGVISPGITAKTSFAAC